MARPRTVHRLSALAPTQAPTRAPLSPLHPPLRTTHVTLCHTHTASPREICATPTAQSVWVVVWAGMRGSVGHTDTHLTLCGAGAQ